MRNETPIMTPRASILKDCSESTDTTATTSLEEDMWNLDLDDLLQMPENNPLRRSLSSCGDDSTRSTRSLGRTASGTVATSKRRNLPKRTVSFDKVKVREFSRALSDNPSCQAGGPAIGLGWEYSEKKDVALDKFETKRIRRKNSKNLEILSPEKREKIAKKLGYTDEQIMKNVKRIERAQRQRKNTEREAMAASSPVASSFDANDPYAIMRRCQESRAA